MYILIANFKLIGVHPSLTISISAVLCLHLPHQPISALHTSTQNRIKAIREPQKRS